MKVSRLYITKVLHEDVNFSFRTAAKLANALKMDFFPALKPQEEGGSGAENVLKTATPVNPKVNDKWYNISRFIREKTQENSVMGYSAAYPTGRERIGDMDESKPILHTATLSNDGGFSIFKSGGDTIRFATSPRLVRYTRVKRREDGYLEVDADYGNGEVEDYIDIRHILDNLYYDTDDFLKGITKVEVCYE